MDDKKIQSILRDALEEEIPSSEIRLWPAIQASLVAGKHHPVQQGERMHATETRRWQRVALTVLMVVALAMVALMTPPGRAFAQTVLQFFRRAESNVLPLPGEQIPSPEEAQALPTAQPPAPIVSVAEAERTAGFDAYELPTVPEGFVFVGAMGTPGSINIQYEAVGGGGALVVTESTDGFIQSEWDQAPVEAIFQVKIGELDAEIVQGTYVVYPGETVAKWNSDAPILRLRWIEDGIWFEMAKFGDVERIEYLDRDRLIELAQSITNDPFPLEVEYAERQAGYNALEPAVIPEGMRFLGASLDPVLNMISLSFGYSESERIILIKQQPVGSLETCELCGLVGTSASVQEVQIQGVPGEYAEGVWVLTDNGRAIWRDDPYLKTIRWQKDEMAFELIYMGTDMDKDKLVALAESMAQDPQER
jgi:hypothetical protein